MRPTGRALRRHPFFGGHCIDSGCTCQFVPSAGKGWQVEGHWFPIVGVKVRRTDTRWWAVLILDDIAHPGATADSHDGVPLVTMKRVYVRHIKDAQGVVKRPCELDTAEESSSSSSSERGDADQSDVSV